MKSLITFSISVLLIIQVCKAQQKPIAELTGLWTAEKTKIEFTNNSSLIFEGVEYPYTALGNFVMFNTQQGLNTLSYQVQGDKLIINYNYVATEFTRGTVFKGTPTASQANNNNLGGNKSVGNGREIAGTWCRYNGNSNYSSSGTFTLKEDGSYTYGSEGGSSGQYGSTYGQSSDAGQWTYDGYTLYCNSYSKAATQYVCKKTYHGNDPALNIGGTEYVTCGPRGPW